MKWGEVIAEHADSHRPASRPSRTASCSPRCGRRRASRRTGSTTSAAWPTRSRARSSRSIAEHLQLHAARAARRRRRDHAVELADVHRDHVAGAGAGRRQHDRAEAVGDHVGLGDRAGAAGRGGAGIPPGVINVVTGFRETGEALVDHPRCREGVVHRQRRRRTRRLRRAPGSGWSAACWSSAARARTSCSTMRTWIRRRRACWRASSRRRGRPASPDRAPTSSAILRQRSSIAGRRAAADHDRRSAGRGDADGAGRDRRCSSRRTSRWCSARSAKAPRCSVAARGRQLAEFPDGYFFAADDRAPGGEGQAS